MIAKKSTNRELSSSSFSGILWYFSYIVLLPLVANCLWKKKMTALQAKLDEFDREICAELKQRLNVSTKLIQVTHHQIQWSKAVINLIKTLHHQTTVFNCSIQEKILISDQIFELENLIRHQLADLPERELSEMSAIANFHQEITTIDQRLLTAQQEYNTSVIMLNQHFKFYPRKMVAQTLKIAPKDVFESTNFQKQTVNVDLKKLTA